MEIEYADWVAFGSAKEIEDLASRRVQELDGGLLRTLPFSDRVHMAETLSDDWQRVQVISSRLGQRLNLMRAPILRLPPELIQMILALAITDCAVTTTTPVPWVHLGHICSRIRSALFSMHEAWARVAFASSSRPEVTEELVRRAAGALLTIRVTENPSHLLKYADMHLQRARSVAISRPMAGLVDELLPRFIGAFFPHLESLHLDNNPVRRSGAAMNTLPLSLPMRAPRLSSLRMRHVLVPFVATNLIELYITMNQYSSCGRAGYTLSRMLGALRVCTQLRTLHLHGTAKHVLFSGEINFSHNVFLPSLQALDIEDRSDGIQWLWSCLSAPLAATVRVHQLEWESDEEIGIGTRLGQLHALARHVRSPGARLVTGLFLGGPVYDLTFRLYDAVPGATPDPQTHAFSPLHRDSSLVLEIQIFDAAPTNQESFDALAQFNDLFGPADIENLELDCVQLFVCDDEDIPAADPASVLSQFRSVHSLCLVGYPRGVDPIIVAAPPEGSEDAVILPRLRSLVFTEQVFEEDSELDSFVAVIERRAAMGAPLHELKIGFNTNLGMDDTEASRSFRARLQSLVPTVEFSWDPRRPKSSASSSLSSMNV